MVERDATPLLFNRILRVDHGPKRQAESSFHFLNRTARPIFAPVREVLEHWFGRYPAAHQNDLWGRFHSRDDFNHKSAFFELFLHELLLALGCTPTVHPPMADTSRRPDFLVESPGIGRFYLEATVVREEESRAAAAANARLSQVIESMDRISSPDFILDANSRGRPDTMPNVGLLKSAVGKWLQTLDHDEVSRLYEAGDWSRLPRYRYQHEDWQVEIIALPRGPRTRGRSDVGAIAMQSGGAEMVQTGARIRSDLATKATRYGRPSLPYVIAVNALEDGVDREDVLEALFGPEVCQVLLKDGELVAHKWARTLDGLWASSSGPRNTRVSAVLVISSLLPWNVPRADIRLYHNPWAAKPYSGQLCRLPQAIPSGDGTLEWTSGESLADIFGLPFSWPEDET